MELNEAKNLVLSTRDFNEAISAGSMILEEDFHNKQLLIRDLRQLQFFEMALIICFMRPFTKNGKGRNRFSVERNAGRELNIEEQKLFAKISRLRNKVIAHGEPGNVSFNKIDLRDVFEANDPRFIMCSPKAIAYLTEEEVERTVSLAREFLRICMVEVINLDEKIRDATITNDELN